MESSSADQNDISNLLNQTSITVENQNKRSGYISWNDYFMATAVLASKRSKDPVTQVGACVVDQDNKIVGIGYNGMPKGCQDDQFPWGKKNANPILNKGLFVCHAEMNAIMNKIAADVKGCTMYVVLFPCNECAKIIIQSGIKEIVYLTDKCGRTDAVASKIMFNAAGVKFRKFKNNVNQIVIDLSESEGLG